MTKHARVILLRGGGTAVHGPVPGAVQIEHSVGKGGVNRRDDARALQIALNAVPESLGGAGESLAVDGLVGPLTIHAIGAFQERWLEVRDARCDPDGPTLALLNAMAGVGDALPPGTAAAAARTPIIAAKPAKHHSPSPAELARIQAAELRQFVVEHHHTSIVLRWLFTALRVNDAAERHVRRLRGLAHGATLPASALGDEERCSFLLVAKTFKLHEHAVAAAEAGIRRVDSILRQSMLLINRHIPRPPVVSPAPETKGPLFVSLFGLPPHVPAALGYTVEGGLHLAPGPSGFFNRFVVPGRVVAERNERIYLPPAFDDINPDLQRLTMIHELAHNVGGSPGQRSGVDEIGTVDRPVKWKGLSSFQRLHTADSFGFFATECNIGTERAVTQSQSTMDAIGEWPKVTASFAAPDPVIALPPSSNPEAAKFNFPAGFT